MIRRSSLRQRIAEPVDAAEVAADLEEIHEQMTELLRQADRLVHSVGNRSIEARAEGYWIAHIKSALGGMGYSTHATTLEDTIGEIANLAYGDDEEEAPYGDPGPDPSGRFYRGSARTGRKGQPPLEEDEMGLNFVKKSRSSYRVEYPDGDGGWAPFIGELVETDSGVWSWDLHWDWDTNIFLQGTAPSLGSAQTEIFNQYLDLENTM